MMGINVRNVKGVPFADLIVDGVKTLETRDSDSLRPYVGKRVAIVRTGKGKAQAIGEVTVGAPILACSVWEFDTFRPFTLVPAGSKFDIKERKYMYPMLNPIRYEKPLPVGLGIIARRVLAP